MRLINLSSLLRIIMEDDSRNKNNCSVKWVYHYKTVVRLIFPYSCENGYNLVAF